MTQISTETFVRRATEGVLCQTVGQETVIIKQDGTASYGLNPVATTVWELADGQSTIADIVSVVCEVYDVAWETALQDTVEWISWLAANELADLGPVPIVDQDR